MQSGAGSRGAGGGRRSKAERSVAGPWTIDSARLCGVRSSSVPPAPAVTSSHPPPLPSLRTTYHHEYYETRNLNPFASLPSIHPSIHTHTCINTNIHSTLIPMIHRPRHLTSPTHPRSLARFARSPPSHTPHPTHQLHSLTYTPSPSSHILPCSLISILPPSPVLSISPSLLHSTFSTPLP